MVRGSVYSRRLWQLHLAARLRLVISALTLTLAQVLVPTAALLTQHDWNAAAEAEGGEPGTTKAVGTGAAARHFLAASDGGVHCAPVVEQPSTGLTAPPPNEAAQSGATSCAEQRPLGGCVTAASRAARASLELAETLVAKVIRARAPFCVRASRRGLCGAR
jgi:hypothetical protein